MFSDILLTVDYDRTLTGPKSEIPQRNLEAIRYFMENGGTFTVNTGRSVPMAQTIIKNVPVNAPLLLYNGSAAYDASAGKLYSTHAIALDPRKTMEQVLDMMPDLLVEVQGLDAHYAFRQDDDWEQFTGNNGCPWKYIETTEIPEPFLKFSVFAKPEHNKVATLFHATPEEMVRMDQANDALLAAFGSSVEVFRAGAKILDVHAKGVSKNRSARELQAALGKKILVCVGDALNDLTMLRGADYSFIPGDAVLEEDFPRVCNCGDGAVADVIYKKIPEILGIKP